VTLSDRPTKERILDAAEEIMLEQSFHSVGLNQILQAVKVPKGSFYHYFESKEHFGVEMLKHYGADASKFKRRVLLSADLEPNPLKRLKAFQDGVIAKFLENGGKCPCLIMKLAAEVANFSEPMRKEMATGIEDWISILKELLDEAVEKNLIPKKTNTSAEAALIQDLWSGAMQRAIICRDTEPMRRASDLIQTRLS
jgi:TetR/AcrR family transcriptional repressor of nem operon